MNTKSGNSPQTPTHAPASTAPGSAPTPTPHLFSPIEFRSLTLPNRIVVSPMCQYSCVNGLANDWHLVHLGSRAVGGAGLVFTEACAVTADGRISPQDLGIWSDEHIPPLARIVDFLHSQGAHAGIQLAHAGRKASTWRPWDGQGELPLDKGGWKNVAAPSALRFADNYPAPLELDLNGIGAIKRAFEEAAHRAREAGFDVVEIHAAHGYLLHEFLSPLSNHRKGEYGGSFENRVRLLVETVHAVREVWPSHLPLFVRISASDWEKAGWTIDDSVRLAKVLREHAVDLVDASSAGNTAHPQIPVGAGYQVPFAEKIRREAGIRTGAVGMITDPAQADQIIRSGQADLVDLAREMLREPYWPMKASQALGQKISWPVQYLRAAPRDTPAREAVEVGGKRCRIERWIEVEFCDVKRDAAGLYWP